MLEYKAWSRHSLAKALKRYSRGELSIVDLQLGGECNYNCIYCDTPGRATECPPRLAVVRELHDSVGLDWLFVCGLGEPLCGRNRDRLLDVLRYCDSSGIGVSMFSNVAYLDAEITRYLDTGCLHILFKLDSLRPDRISRLYGIHTPELHLGKVMEVLDAVLVSEGQTNLAASIVMTKENLDELDVLLDFCDDSRVFPLVADLEESGRGKRVAEELRLDESELRLVRETLEARYGPGYGIPICPSVIAGMHVTPDDHVIVDEATGLSCHWFWLTEPKVHTVGVLACGYGYQEAARDVIRYRTEQLPEVERLVASGTSLTLGGCGGDIQAMLRRYLEAHSVATCQPR